MRIAILAVSDSRSAGDDTSGDYLVEAIQTAGHVLHDRKLLKDDLYLLRAAVSVWIADPQCHAILITGGTGFTGRDSTPEALEPLLNKQMPGFGELFRMISFNEIGTSALQSRAFAGLANATFIAALPGSTNACRTAWTQILLAQLDETTKPCNLANLRGRFLER